METFAEYSQYYNLLYRDKDYPSESNFIHNLIQSLKPDAKTILDLGCGTGRHAKLLSDKGYSLHGVDRSNSMLEIARSENKDIPFTLGDIRSVRLNQTFDVAIALFHVISYQTSNQDLYQSLKTVFHHLVPGGLLIFDCWYGPTVLRERPTVRIKRVNDPTIEITRIAEPVLDESNNTVLVNYHLFINSITSIKTTEIKETHAIRYFFRPELQLALQLTGFTLEQFTTYDLNPNCWDLWVIARKK
ncbi:MAG TPA: class I SAM-dependent methyltransferase [Bacillota bacterium]|nr:class I SAM-dependent methyltransferase [Bacillota bacterium]HOL10535.1 class I SAM-dependent methyltransferase [Bacillota bacterium]HPO98273.1 class I SAM-dependent methyltransferase [Bacillota bacterium]